MRKVFLLISFLISPFLSQGAITLNVAGVQQEVGGATKTVLSSGGTENFVGTTSVGSFAVFNIQDNNSNDIANLKVTYAADNGSVGSNVMIGRTVDSQGMTDVGTVTVLITVGNGSGGTIDLGFDWYTPGSFIGGVEQVGSSLISSRINYTTFDIDFKQLVSVREDEMAAYSLDGSTLLTASTSGGLISFKDNNANSDFDNPLTAVEFLSLNGPQTHTITVGKQASIGNALFMFEFRDPSTNVTFTDPTTTEVPEPETFAMVLSLSCLIGVTYASKRRKANR